MKILYVMPIVGLAIAVGIVPAKAGNFSGIWQCKSMPSASHICFKGQCNVQSSGSVLPDLQIDWSHKRLSAESAPFVRFTTLISADNIRDLFSKELDHNIPYYVRASEEPNGSKSALIIIGDEGNSAESWSYNYVSC